MPFLVVEEKGSSRHYPIRGRQVAIGRAPDNDIMLADEKASRHHCVLTLAPDNTLTLRDLQSRNGTFMRGEKVLERPIEVGENFQIGQAKIFVYSEESSAFETHNAMEAISATIAPQAGPVAVGINEALGALAYACAEDTPKAFLESAAQFVGRIIPGMRVCIATANKDGAAEPRAFFNFISGTPTDELPAFFKATANRLVQG